ncbi:type II toxin-antitoxin system RatA family toxin [Chitinimonas lacunae]|uniref:Type II toxin-antitoxin system RatA family toxin n=1 Tax=Chitinimonas lacunae TaxID=1963018 RepID=A0ABV8MLH2_9NEIS
MKVTVSTFVRRNAHELFELSQDYQRRLEWDNYLVAAHLLGGHHRADVGVDSYCKSRLGQVMVSRYVSFKPPQVAAVSMVEGPWVLKEFSGSWRFTQSASQGTLVAFTYHLRTRPRFLHRIMEPMLAVLYRQQMQSRLEAFKRWAEQLPEPVPVQS